MRHLNVLFQKFQQQISRHLFQNSVEQHLEPNSARSFTHQNHFHFMMYCILKQVSSLREAVTSFNYLPERLYHTGFSSPVKLSTVTEANAKRSHLAYKTLFENLLATTQRRFKRMFAFPLYILDSSQITFKNRHSKWAELSSKTDGIKVHLMLDAVAGVPVSVEITNGKVADITVAKEADMEPGSFHLRDRAYWDSEYLHKQHRNGAYFIIRAKKSLNSCLVKQLPVYDDKTQCSERIIQLTGSLSQEYCDHLRAVQIYDERKGEYFEVFTNNRELPAETIAALYKSRWQIELFFKWLKQRLKFKTLLGYNENAVKLQIWIAMITFLLLWQMHQNPEYRLMDFLDFLRYVQTRLFLRDARLTNIEKPPDLQLWLPSLEKKL